MQTNMHFDTHHRQKNVNMPNITLPDVEDISGSVIGGDFKQSRMG